MVGHICVGIPFQNVCAYVIVGVTKTNFRISWVFTLFVLNEYYIKY